MIVQPLADALDALQKLFTPEACAHLGLDTVRAVCDAWEVQKRTDLMKPSGSTRMLIHDRKNVVLRDVSITNASGSDAIVTVEIL